MLHKEKNIGNNVLQSATGFSGDMLAGAGIGYGIYDTVKTYKNFEKQMSAVGAILRCILTALAQDGGKAAQTLAELGVQT